MKISLILATFSTAPFIFKLRAYAKLMGAFGEASQKFEVLPVSGGLRFFRPIKVRYLGLCRSGLRGVKFKDLLLGEDPFVMQQSSLQLF
jgi:hypothetical protein